MRESRRKPGGCAARHIGSARRRPHCSLGARARNRRLRDLIVTRVPCVLWLRHGGPVTKTASWYTSSHNEQPFQETQGTEMSTGTAAMATRTTASDATRWGQLIFGIICMVMIANLQYGWTLFVNPIDQKYHWGRAAIQVAFTIFVVTETWLVPFEGYLIDRFGPRVMVCGSGVLVAIAWVMNAYADSLALLYLAAAIGGIGAGVIYGASVGNALKWFPDRRGLAAGLTAAGFGAGSALPVVPIANMIASSGFEAAFLWFGIGQGVIVVIFSLFLRAPAAGEVPVPAAPAVQQTRRDYGPAEVLTTPPFWVMYVMFVMVGTGGLMATAQLGPIAKDFRIDNVPVTLLGLTLPALQFALSIDRVLNGLTPPFFCSGSVH